MPTTQIPDKIQDTELGEVLFPVKSLDKAEREKRQELLKLKIDYTTGEATGKSLELKEPEPQYVEELEREKSLRKQAEEKAELTQKNLDTLIDKVLQENEVDEAGTETVRETTNTDETTEE